MAKRDECPECPAEHKANEQAWREGYEKGRKVREALKRYASGGRVELLERAIRKHGHG